MNLELPPYPELTYKGEENFSQQALQLFYYQAAHNPVYCQYLQLLNIDPESIKQLRDIPYLPVSLFKSHSVTCRPGKTPEQIFLSSRTTGGTPSRHLVFQPEWYKKIARAGYTSLVGDLSNTTFLSCLPSYRENSSSSLIFMVEDFAQASGHPLIEETAVQGNLPFQLQQIIAQGRKPVLFGVTAALLPLAEKFSGLEIPFTLIETGGMKGKGKEITRAELHMELRNSFSNAEIISEYGMTEMLSQAYSSPADPEKFTLPPWAKISIREQRDPLSNSYKPGRGAINMTDLANIDSCAFLALEDLAELFSDGRFSVLGRMDKSEIRGCNLLIEG